MTDLQFEMLIKVEEYYESEYISIARVINNTLDRQIFSPAEACRNTLQRMLGIALFIQVYIPYEEITPLYEEYKTKVENLYLTN